MLKYLIRLDDACPYMNKDKWDRMEQLLDKYNIKPIVGIIPDCKDEEFMNNDFIEDFWGKYAIKWQEKAWIIAQHGLNHQLTNEVRTEFSDKSYDEQYRILREGYKLLKSKGIISKCFFAPNHTFDDETIKAIANLKKYSFISDGYAIFPYKYNDVIFMPSVFDTPHKILPFGVWTFVFHPNNMSDFDYEYLEKFIQKHKDNFALDINVLLRKYENRKRNLFDKLLEKLIIIFRKVRNKNEE